jgi:hypothetical protein
MLGEDGVLDIGGDAAERLLEPAYSTVRGAP